jgi:class 3 adenylate cyclase
MHQRDDRVIPVGHARALAAALPDSRFLLFDGDSNVPWHGGATQQMLDAVIDFCGLRPRAELRPAASALCTILFTDVEGSTALTERLGDVQARDILRRHERVVREQLAGQGGSEIKALGDGFMASFLSTSRALECAMAIQRALADAWQEEALRVRIGLNAGEPIEEDADLFGSAVNKAARVASAAAGGQILVTNVVKELAEGKRFTFVDRGETSLRGFQGATRLYELRWREEE